MLTARAIIILVVTVAVISLLATIYELAGPPDTGGRGNNTYGTHALGQRALYETLEELRLPVQRGLVPPSGIVRDQMSLVLWDSDEQMVKLEPGHLKNVAQWLREGGRIIAAIQRPMEKVTHSLMTTKKGDEFARDTSLLKELGLPDVKFNPTTVVTPLAVPSQGGEDADSFFSNAATKLPTPVSRSASADGDLTYLKGLVAKLSIPEKELRSIDPDSLKDASGRLSCRDADGNDQAIAATYKVGKGEVVVVSETHLFENAFIAKDDNAVLAAHLFSHGGGPVVFDEFYHGLTVRGNPFWLLAHFPYNLLAAMLVATTLLWAWRESVHLGPPLRDTKVNRRSIAEYVEATARLFQKGDCRRYQLLQVNEGVLWLLQRRLSQHPKHATAESVSAALQRKDPAAAERLREAAAEADTLIRQSPSETAVVKAAEHLTRCL